MTFGQRNHDFAVAQTNVQIAYIEAERENLELRDLVSDMWELMRRSGTTTGAWGPCKEILGRIHALGIEVDDG